jgi:acyl carrier protein
VRERLRIVVGGYLGLLPAAGVTWDYVQYPAGFAALGHDVFYIEDTRLWPIYQPAGSDWGDCSGAVAHLAAVMEDFGLAGRWAYRDEASGRCFGLSEEKIREVCRTADVFVNVSCSTFLRDEYRAIPARALIDTDPMFTQVQHMSQQMFTPGAPGLRELIDGHNHHFTFGESVGRPECRMPDCGIEWRPTRQPIRLDLWKPLEPARSAGSAFTTLMNWTAAKPLEHDGTTWGQKNVEFERFFDLPSRVPGIPLAVAVGQTGDAGAPFPADAARAAGWRVLDPEVCAPDCAGYTRLQFLEPGRATPASTFEDLGMTSLDSLSLIADLEEQFQIEIPNDQAMAVSTVRQAVECVRRLVPDGALQA